jgi:hypothetical protein
VSGARSVFVGLALAFAGACGGATAAGPPPPVVSTSPRPETSTRASTSTTASTSTSTSASAAVKGPAAFSVHVEPGKRQPLDLVGAVQAIEPPRGDSGLDAWSEMRLSTASGEQKIYVLSSPPELLLPFAVGERIKVALDCRRGGWHRVCDATVSDMTRRVLAIVSGSGSDDVAEGWKITRGAVAVSEERPGAERSVLHTYALRFESEGASVTAMPHEWKRLLVHGRGYLVTGYEEVWEGVRPPDARDHRVFAIVLQR